MGLLLGCSAGCSALRPRRRSPAAGVAEGEPSRAKPSRLRCAPPHNSLTQHPFCCRLFGTKCDKCGLSFSKNDFVMRAKTKIYHIECFRCTACERQLIPGDEFALRDDGLFCKEDHEHLDTKPHPESNNNSTTANNNNTTLNHHSNEGSNSGERQSHCDRRVRGGALPGADQEFLRVP